MPSTPRKSTARPAQRDAEPAATVERLDLLDCLATEPLPPLEVTLLGVDADIRREFTGKESVRFFQLLNAGKHLSMLQLIVGDDAGAALWEKVSPPVPPAHAAKVINRIVNLSTLAEGEILAPLPTS
ncbi:hypothetical protein CH305_18495 [Rhodococcus sp. 15-649-2-2]|uniref:hypothetical protein n=1 Tax=Rhodococcus sp. 15-649-2-2 TaxID=2023140 RepID=UPI000B9C5425|nr:hypothetical protein [Rhodococcus sp. 15-649-2-2]OZE77226.1 hypothetical protein CH305_18495 [Rhodococcus sp. 15-649-2-2]